MSKKISYRIPVCIFIFVVGSITALLFASVLNDVLTTGSISTDLTDFSTIFSGVFGGEKPRKLYLLLEALVVLLCVVYFVCAERTYQTDTYKVTDNISVPVPIFVRYCLRRTAWTTKSSYPMDLQWSRSIFPASGAASFASSL